MMNQSWKLWIGVLVLFSLDLCVSADELGSLNKSWRDTDVQVKNNNNQEQQIFRKYCESSQIKGCDRGYYRERRGPYKGQCLPCNCNGLSNECDQHTGKCLNCQFNTAGDHCDRCMEGYYGSATLRTCHICPCPFTDPSNSFALGCLKVGDDFECLCKAGYSGVRCERCSLGYYGNPLAERGNCQPCDCDHGYACDQFTGDCYEADEPDTGDCLECDICATILLDDLEAVDKEFLTLKTQLQSLSQNSASLTTLRKLEDAIAGTKVLVKKYTESVHTLNPKVTELESDIESAKDDLTVLSDKAIQTSCTAVQLLKTLEKTYQRGGNLHSESVNFLQKIQEFLDQLKQSNHTGGNTEEATRILKEARRMLVEMRRQNCKTQRGLAKEELRKAQTLFNLIMNNLMVPLNHTSVAANRIGQKLMEQAADLRDIQEALIDAELDVNKANDVNKKNEKQLEDILRHLKVLEKEQGNIMADVNMTRRTLKDTSDHQKMMEDLTKEMNQLAAQIDGAKNYLNAKLDLLSKATAKERIVRRAEEHAQELMNLAMDFQIAILNITNSSAVQKAIEAIRAFTDVTDAIREAEAAANWAKKVADQVLEDVQGQDLQNKAKHLKEHANKLLIKAKKAEKNLQDVTQKSEAYRNLIQQAEDKQSQLRQAMQDVVRKLNNNKRDDIGILIDQTKEDAFNINTTASDVMARIQNISEELNNTRIPSHESNLNNIIDDVNKTLAELDQSFPSLINKLQDMENQSEHLPSPANMSSSIRRIKDLIESARDMANRIRGPIFFSGDAHIELRPPKDLEDFRAFTAINLTLHRPEVPTRGDGRRRRQENEGENLFVLYLGNKHTVTDYIGMVVRNGVLFCVYKLGGILYEIETSEITKSKNDKAFMDRVDFRRVYQDAVVFFTKVFTSTEPKALNTIPSLPQTTVGLLDLDSNEVALFVGGYPSDFTPPEELRYPGYKGCIEFSTLNDHILGLFNFQHAVNINKNDICLRGKVRTSGYYFDGTGYVKVEVLRKNSIIKFFVQSHQMEAVLFYMGNETSYYFVEMEGGYIVLQGATNDKIIFEKTKEKVFFTNFIQIRITLNNEDIKVQATDSGVNIYLGYVKGFFEEAYIGGVPGEVREKYNIILPSLRGCVNTVQVDITAVFTEEVGIVPGCPNPLLGVRQATFKRESFLSVPPSGEDTEKGTMASLGFKSFSHTGVLLQTGGTKNEFELYLSDGFVHMRDTNNNLRSKNKYEIGKWHYVTAFKNSSGMQLNVDNTNLGDPQLPSIPKGMENEIVLGNYFDGCLRNFYIRSLQKHYIPEDLSSFSQTGNVSLGFCKEESPPQKTAKKRARHAGITSDSKSGNSKQGSRYPKFLKHTHHLGSNSQLQFSIDSEELNNRPHFSLDVQTKSSNGLLLHIIRKQGVPLVVLYLADGKVTLSVGSDKITSSQRINNGNWHNIKFIVKKRVFLLAVDDVRIPDGRLSKGFAHGLRSPVYVGYGQLHMANKTQGKAPFQKSIIGCIRDLKFSNVLLTEPAVNHGATPCFKGMSEKGAYFAGDGAQVVLENYLISGSTFNLAFEFRPRNLTGLLFHKRNHHGQTLTVFLKSGKVVVNVYDGRRHYGTAVTPIRPLCAAFNYVAVSTRRKTIELRVNEATSRVKGPTVPNPSAHETIYIGGISEKLFKEVEVWTSYAGCLRNLHLNKTPISLEHATSVFGPINTTKCPVENRNISEYLEEKCHRYNSKI
ncbi:laminin subunit alpha-3 [Myxocyprinus asiaticus]|uniref:laminin subunit alpha-3 n=1 Tax=Myxocyprinus asiaticus TaxID=70543 RepID=UPI002223EAD2|nr:laminin subunit alpha-3 [Myxocyprinus asiaticus]